MSLPGLNKFAQKILDMSSSARMARASDQAYNVDDVYTHTGGNIEEIKRGGLFDGVFSVKGDDGYQMGGDIENKFIFRRPVAGSGDVDIDYDKAMKTIKKEYPDASDEELDMIYDMSAGDRNVYDMSTNPLERYGYDDIGEASWEGQRIRGRIANDQGFDAIAMSDEQGTSYLIPHGSSARSVNAAFDPAKSKSANILASAAGVGLVGGAALAGSENVEAGTNMQPHEYAGQLEEDLKYAESQGDWQMAEALLGQMEQLEQQVSSSTARQPEAQPAPVEGRSIAEVLGSNPKIAKMQELVAADSGGDPSRAAQLRKGLQAEIQKTMELEELRATNPHLAETIEAMPQWQKSAGIFGRGLHDVSRGLGLEGEEEDTAALDVLGKQTQGAEGSRMLGQMAPFAPLGVGAGAIRSTIPRVAAYSALGGTEGYTSQVGEGKDPTLATAIGVAVPPLASVAPRATRFMADVYGEYAEKRQKTKRILGAATPDDIVDEAEAIVRTGGADAQTKLDDLIVSDDAAVSIHPTVRKIRESVEGGGTADEVAEIIESQKGLADSAQAAQFRLEGAKLKKSVPAKKLISQGVRKSDVQMISAASEGDKVAFGRIIERARKGMENSKFGAKFPPQAVVGDSLLDRLKAVTEINKDAGKRINQVAKSELKGRQVSLDQPLMNFKSKLDEFGVTFDGGKINFEGSALMDLPDLQAPIKRILKRIDPARSPNVDAYDAHILKRWFDKNISHGKTPAGGGLDADVEIAIKGFRRDINTELGLMSKKYEAVNTQYADTIGPINDLRTLAGRSRDLSGDFADETLGRLSRRVTSNAMSRGTVSKAIEDLENVSAKYGKVFKDDIATQVIFINALERRMGAFSDTSFMGQIDAPLARMGANTAAGGMPGVSDAIDVVKAIKGKISPADEASFLKAIEDLIKGE